MIIRWKRIYETGMESTDQWHKKLVYNINEVYKHICTEHEFDHVAEVIDQMIKDSIIQFSAEEKFFSDHDFTHERIEKHTKEHDLFIEVSKNASKKIRSGDLLESYKLADFLRSWIVLHMLGSDKEFAIHFNNNKKIIV